MLQAGAGGGEVSIPNTSDAEALPRSCSLSREEFDMHKTLIVSLAVLGLSTSAALAAKHHAKKPAASTAMSTPSPMMPFGTVSSADKEMYMRNKRESGVK
jgi:hypothetical protein